MKKLIFITLTSLLITSNIYSQYNKKTCNMDSITYEEIKQKVLANHPELNDSIIRIFSYWKKNVDSIYNPIRSIKFVEYITDFFYFFNENIINTYTMNEICFLFGKPDDIYLFSCNHIIFVYSFPTKKELKYCMEEQNLEPKDCGHIFTFHFGFDGYMLGAGPDF